MAPGASAEASTAARATLRLREVVSTRTSAGDDDESDEASVPHESDEARAAALPHRATAEVDLYRSQVRHMVEKSVQIQPHFTTANASHS